VIRLRYNLGEQSGGGDSEVSLSAVNVSDGAWHSVHVERQGRWSVLSLDHGEGAFTNETSLASSTGGAAGHVQFRIARRGLVAGADVRFPSATSTPLVSHDFVDGELAAVTLLRLEIVRVLPPQSRRSVVKIRRESGSVMSSNQDASKNYFYIPV